MSVLFQLEDIFAPTAVLTHPEASTVPALSLVIL